jgi:hypothetical protein
MTKEHPVICYSLKRNSVYSVLVNAFFYTGRHHLSRRLRAILTHCMMSPNKHSKPNQCVMYCVRFPESERQMATPL